MDVLNKNQRNSARWRVAALLGIVLLLNVLIVHSMHQSYRSGGAGEIESLTRELEELKTKKRGDEQKLRTKIVTLQGELKAYKESAEREGSMEAELNEFKIKSLEGDLEICKTSLNELTIKLGTMCPCN